MCVVYSTQCYVVAPIYVCVKSFSCIVVRYIALLNGCSGNTERGLRWVAFIRAFLQARWLCIAKGIFNTPI